MSQRNRREFLEDSMFAAASAVAANTPSELFAESSCAGSSPNARLGVAVVGVRGRGNSHIGAFAGRKDAEIVYICDADSQIGGKRVEEVAKRQRRQPSFVEDIRHLLEDPSVDIVSIATPHHLHALMAIWSMQAGKDVYLEKPVSHNISEGRRIVETARKYKRICQSGTQCRSNPGMVAAVQYVHAGRIGHVRVARGLCYKRRLSIGPPGTYQPPNYVNYHLWLGPAPYTPLTRRNLHHDWHWQSAYGNGDLGHQGVHQIDVARWGLGVHRPSERVFSYGGRFGYRDAGDTPNTQVVVHDYGEQSLVFEVRSLLTTDYRRAKIGVIFEGSDGYLVMHSYQKGAAFDLQGNKVAEFRGGGNHFSNFLNAVRSRRIQDLSADIEEGHVSSSLCHLGNISYQLGRKLPVSEAVRAIEAMDTGDEMIFTLERTLDHLRDNHVPLEQAQLRVGQPLTFDPAQERFIGNDLANSMLTRSYRQPFVVPSASDV